MHQSKSVSYEIKVRFRRYKNKRMEKRKSMRRRNRQEKEGMGKKHDLEREAGGVPAPATEPPHLRHAAESPLLALFLKTPASTSSSAPVGLGRVEPKLALPLLLYASRLPLSPGPPIRSPETEADTDFLSYSPV